MEFKIPYVTNVEFNSRIGGQVVGFLQKSFIIAGKNQGFGVQIQLVIRPGKALQQPAAEKARATGDEYLWPRSSSHRSRVWVRM